ncbi:hypothetical protein C5C45_14560 [Rathayibacter rathayi]|uniref:Uncharacterized protein n=2 Tax=Rathayibacter rathayi TaxID=33887 RepID=A0ABD6W4X9_RATRA|nr:hypothetical protein C5C04_14615 [Rathayibacter rathayi]PPF41681.1 hypothetical protein C5C08_15910 [Rathayibacter rathayi]PPF72983.1 hypothetical protein C5C14_15800 [Rathayibacter rathayi]PPG07483.1 hypothetical protein C5C11_16095 [Rathayibacter rathayi]PPG36846.1 hypothetical protein C5C20_14770 [Rathayibacter rathayi]
MDGMKHILFADKTILVGDEAADALVEYAVALAAKGTADSVEYSGIGADGASVDATFLVNAAAALVVETTPSDLPEPDNAREVARVRQRIHALTGEHPVQPGDGELTAGYDDLHEH